MRQTPLSRRPVKWRPPRNTGPDPATRELVLARDGWRCVCCGRSVIGQQYSLQHRKRRSHGGTNSPVNLITVLGSGITGCHWRIDSRADPADELNGYTVRSGQDPALVPVRVFGARVWARPDGTWAHEPPPPPGEEAA